ncbi:hypothetical protein JMN32_25010 [Fulvivirga sp. 29W222]|uniref:Uncharacterized protein n=1 Tax=Fulvivirga marina TaxID=2494733 RepID=A0A937G419_9BACT|nr:hypothetical protein [Fulvivirga marina]MBL6449595.1 hypothetical protein [Fulvivirga marina]
MKKLIMVLLLLLTFAGYAQTQIDSVNTLNQVLKFNQLNETTNTYLVYFQDSISGPKRNMEIWERTITKVQKKGVYKFIWNRYLSNGSYVNCEILSDINSFKPISE